MTTRRWRGIIFLERLFLGDAGHVELHRRDLEIYEENNSKSRPLRNAIHLSLTPVY